MFLLLYLCSELKSVGCVSKYCVYNESDRYGMSESNTCIWEQINTLFISHWTLLDESIHGTCINLTVSICRDDKIPTYRQNIAFSINLAHFEPAHGFFNLVQYFCCDCVCPNKN